MAGIMPKALPVCRRRERGLGAEIRLVLGKALRAGQLRWTVSVMRGAWHWTKARVSIHVHIDAGVGVYLGMGWSTRIDLIAQVVRQPPKRRNVHTPVGKL